MTSSDVETNAVIAVYLILTLYLTYAWARYCRWRYDDL